LNNTNWPKRLFALDVSRGLAALAVVLRHWIHFFYAGSALPENFDKSVEPLYGIFRILYERGELGVEYFFLLSGFIFFWLYRSSIADRSTSLRDFWVQRFSRLYPLHFATLLVVACLQMLYVSYHGHPFVYYFNDAYHFFLNLLFVSKWGFEKGLSFNYPVWSISVEILLYFLFFFTAYSGQGRGPFCLGVSVISFFLAIFIPSAIVILQAASLFFLGGFIFHLTLLVSPRSQKWKIGIYVITVAIWILTIADFYMFDFSNIILRLGVFGNIFLLGYAYYILFPLTLFSLVLIEIDHGPGFLKPVSWVGDISYSSYLLHFPLQLLFVLGVSMGLLNPNFYLNPIYLILYFLLLIPLSYITFIGFERPIQNAIRNKYRSRVVTTSNL